MKNEHNEQKNAREHNRHMRASISYAQTHKYLDLETNKNEEFTGVKTE